MVRLQVEMLADGPVSIPVAAKTPVTVKGRKTPVAKPSVRSAKPIAVSEEVRSVGKHNKTERRYRQKVQAAQSDLRDAVPALRVLYGTSTEEQKQTTDFRSSDGTVDGLGEFNRPNASAKTTIFLGARMYIELLQSRVETLQRKVDELESFRAAVAGQDNLHQWRNDFEAREAVRQAAIRAVRREEDSSDDEEDSEEEEPKRKKARATKAKKVVDARTFAAFAVSFAFLPSTSTFFPSATQVGALGHVYEPATTAQVFRRFPLIVAEHLSRLLARTVAPAIAPSPVTLVDWTWRLLLAYGFTIALKSLLRRWSQPQEHLVPIGKVSVFVQDTARALLPRKKISSNDAADWIQLAANVVGGGELCGTRFNVVDNSHARVCVEPLSFGVTPGILRQRCAVACTASAPTADPAPASLSC